MFRLQRQQNTEVEFELDATFLTIRALQSMLITFGRHNSKRALGLLLIVAVDFRPQSIHTFELEFRHSAPWLAFN
ncbi:hypothetical protein TSPI_08497 [Trichinella spiralis]|uniref:Uncharacterized protein n=1 Tax=Trichinella spiralis TaxID=6334 RepID=A0ABR3KYQ1_TRISP